MEQRPATTTGLAREAIGLREVLFQSITHMAPAAAVAFSIIAGAGFAAGALPLSVLLALSQSESPPGGISTRKESAPRCLSRFTVLPRTWLEKELPIP